VTIFILIQKIKMLIDSNILIYALNLDSPKSRTSQKFLKENMNHLEISHQNILESIRVLTHSKFSNPMQIKDCLKALAGISESAHILYPDQQTYYLVLELIEKYKLKGNRIFDAYLVAIMLSYGIKQIATDNERDFKIYKGIEVINPFNV
jgi:predicted nucleic acid-binding protein